MSSAVNLIRMKRKSGTFYQLDYRSDGKRIRKTVGDNKETALLMQAKIQKDLIEELIQKKAKVKISLKTLIDEYTASRGKNVRPSSASRYKVYFERFTNFMKNNFPIPYEDIEIIKENFINEFIEDAKTNPTPEGTVWSESTANSAMVIIKSLFKYAVEQEFIKKSPTTNIKTHKRVSQAKASFFSDDELENIYRELKPQLVDPIKFIVNTGLRKGELINLIWENVNLTAKKPYISVTDTKYWKTKTGESRQIPLNSTAVEILKRQVGKHATFVFTGKEGGKMGPNKIYDDFKLTLDKLKLEGDVHKLRKTFASKLASQGVSQFTISKLLGHKDQKTTEVYTILSDDHLHNAVESIGMEDKIGKMIKGKDSKIQQS